MLRDLAVLRPRLRRERVKLRVVVVIVLLAQTALVVLVDLREPLQTLEALLHLRKRV